MAKQNKIDIDQLYGLNKTDNAFIETENQRDNTILNEHFGVKLSHTSPKVATLNIECFRTTMVGENSDTPYTTTNFSHYRAHTYTLGTNQTVTNNFGFHAGATLTFGINNFGFYSNISSFAPNRWNFYANGTAPNYFAGDVRVNGFSLKKITTTSIDTSAILTTSSLLNGIRTTTPTTDIEFTLPTGANMESSMQNLQVDMGFDWVIVNLSLTNKTTVLANTNHTVIGNMEVLVNTSGRFITKKTATNTFITYRA